MNPKFDVKQERNFLLRQVIQLQELLLLAEGNSLAMLSVQNHLAKVQRKLSELPIINNEVLPFSTAVSDKTIDNIS